MADSIGSRFRSGDETIREKWEPWEDGFGMTIWYATEEVTRRVSTAMLEQEARSVSITPLKSAHAATLPTRNLREALESIGADCLVPYKLNGVFESAADATVRVWRENCLNEGCTLGSGFVFREGADGQVNILTNAHVIAEFDSVGITLGEHRGTGEVVDRDAELDLAIVSACCFPNSPALKLGKTRRTSGITSA